MSIEFNSILHYAIRSNHE